jgi:hypothetical protein
MRYWLLIVLCLFYLSENAQVNIKGPWTGEVGASTNTGFERWSLNLRYISPRFRWSEEYIEDEDKHPELKGMRLMVEVIYTPPFKVFCMSFNVQYRLVKVGRFSGELYGGPKLFIVTGPDFTTPRTKIGQRSDIWYLNMGLLCQLDLGIVGPFVDFSGDRILTVGTEVNLRAIYKRPKGRYHLKTQPAKKSRDI